jgi:histidine phosphotransferase ChpT
MMKNKVKLLLNMLLIAGQSIPRGGQLTVDPIGDGEAMGFKVTASGTNAKILATTPPLLAGEHGAEPLNAHHIQPFYAGLLARAVGVTATMTMDGDTVVVAAQ